MICLMFVFIFAVCVSIMFLPPIFRAKNLKIVPGENVKVATANRSYGSNDAEIDHGEKENAGFEDSGM